MSMIQMDRPHHSIEDLILNIEKVLIGKRKMIELGLVALLAKGHVLLEDVPGVGKTMFVRALAKSIGGEFKRIQFTPDLLPTDVTGANVVLADEINRTSPKTQSALLEAMEEHSVTIDGNTYELNQPFFVMATQNPLEYEGTFPLPEAQLDRFLLQLQLGYPTEKEEMAILTRMGAVHPIESLKAVISVQEIVQLQAMITQIKVTDSVKEYMVRLSQKTRSNPSVYLGISPRGTLALCRAAQAYAFIQGRDYVIPDDVKVLVPPIFRHRLILKPEARMDGETPERFISRLLQETRVPVH